MTEILKPIAIAPVFTSAGDVKTASSCLVFLKLTLNYMFQPWSKVLLKQKAKSCVP